MDLVSEDLFYLACLLYLIFVEARILYQSFRRQRAAARRNKVPKFSVATVEALEYDFTGIPAADGNGFCKGKGVIPEPSQSRLEAFSNSIRELYGVDKDASAEEVEKKMDRAEAEADAKKKGDALLDLTAEFCQNTPSKEQLEMLPPRIQRAFFKHIFKEISDPEV